MKLKFYVLILALSLNFQLLAQDVYINLNNPHQGIDGVGFCHEGDRQNGDNYVINTSIQQMLDNHMTLFRDMLPNKKWEPSKGTFNYTDPGVVNCFQRLKMMQDRGIKIILGIWDVPNWMVSNPTAGSNRKINNFDDFAYFITSFLVHGKNNYGLNIDYVDVNETKTSGVNISLTAQEYITLIQKCQTLFTANGLSTKMNLGSVLLWDLQYCKDIYNAVKGLSVSGHPSWHTYRGGSTTGREPISYWEDWGAWQQTLDRNLWGTETDYDAYYWLNDDRLTWQGVEEMAVMYYRNYYVARLSTSAGWFWHPEWPSNNVHTAYMNHFEPGGQIVEASQPNADIMTVAYKHESKKKFVIQVLNQGSSAHTVNFYGVPANKALTLIRTSEAGDRSKTIGIYTPNGTTLTITLQPNSFNTLVGDLETTCTTYSLPGTLQAENYCSMNGIQTETTSDAGGGQNVGWIDTGDWMDYNVNIPSSASYTLGFRVASLNGGGQVQLRSGSNVLATANISSTGGWQNWTTVTTNANLTAGNQTLRIYASVGGFNINYLQVSGNVTNPAPTVTITSPATGANFTAPASVSITANASDANGTVSSVSFYNGTTLLATDATSPYSFTWTNVQEGNYSITAKATDNEGASTTSSAVNISVNNAASTNIAYNRPVTVSSSEGTGYEGTKAVDANGTTRWSSAYANNQNFVVDLGANYTINRIKIAWEAAYARDYQIQISTDNSTWTTIKEFWGKSSSAADDYTNLNSTARWLKVYCINRATAYGFSIFEFEAYGSLSQAITNVAYNKAVTTSSNENSTNTGSKAVDANGTTRWSSTYANNQNFVVDLGANYNINRIRIAWEAAYARDYQIQVSTDNSTWTTIKEFWGKSSAAADDYTGLSSTARWVKVYCINRATTYGFSIFEFEVYGIPAGARLSTSEEITERTPLYPNPAHEQTTLHIAENLQNGGIISIMNSSGKIFSIEKVKGEKHQLNLSTLPSGMYLINVSNATGKKVYKLFKE